MSELKAIMPAEAVRILARVADHMLRGAPAAIRISRWRSACLVVRYLTDKGFGATWEAENGAVIHTSNCPYRGVAEQHPELVRWTMP